MPDGAVMWRMDCGTESSTEKEKGESSDSFKRASVNWGVGRFLYDLDIIRLPANELKTSNNYPHVVNDFGKKVWDLTKHIINLNPQNAPDTSANNDANEMWQKALEAVKTAPDMDTLRKHFSAAVSLCSTPAEQQELTTIKDNRKKELAP